MREITLEEALAAIRRKCVDCCGGSRREAAACDWSQCPLHAVRDGVAPEKPQKQINGQIEMELAGTLT